MSVEHRIQTLRSTPLHVSMDSFLLRKFVRNGRIHRLARRRPCTQACRHAGAHGKLAHVPAACGAVDLDVPNRFGARSGRTPIMNRMLQRAPRLLLLARRPVTAVNVAKPAQVYCRVAERHPVKRGYFDTSPGRGIGSSPAGCLGPRLSVSFCQRLVSKTCSGPVATAVCAGPPVSQWPVLKQECVCGH